ncbi:MAG TPA: DUF1353 domain-containing protein [Acidimicrobiales bacterium]|nr:DUF1353 domain-containing protein [Acidimicrobiales bacterium]
MPFRWREPVAPVAWGTDTRPFTSAVEPKRPGRFVLGQVDDDTFALERAVVFTRPEGMRGGAGRELVLHPAWLSDTDLASIPSFLGWFARRHGRHTPAALLHDLLIKDEDDPWPEGLPADWQLEPVDADLLFRELLVACEVPLVRSYLMWAGVTARTRWHSGLRRRLALLVWFLAALAGTVLIGVAIATSTWWLLAVALLAPVPAAVLWGKQFGAGIVAGYAFWWVVTGSVPAFLAYQAYRLVEWVVWHVRKRLPTYRDKPPTEAPPPPVPFDKR